MVFRKVIKGKEQFIAPQYLKDLPKKGKEYKFFHALKEERKLQFKLKYDKFLPENVMINVLSEYGPYATDVIYRNGIYFKKQDQSEGCVIACNEATRVIEVYTSVQPLAKTIAKTVFEQFLSLSKKTEVHIAANQENKWVDCQLLLKAIADNRKAIPTVDGTEFVEISVFKFLIRETWDHQKTDISEPSERGVIKRPKTDRPKSPILEIPQAADAKTFEVLESIDSQVNLLFLAASPLYLGQIDTGGESRFQDRILLYDEKKRIRFREAHGLTSKRFQGLLFTDDPHIFHYGGHGSKEGLHLQDKELDSKFLIDLLKNNEHTQCVVLNACDTLEIAKKIAAYVPYVIATCDKIKDPTAVAFADGFYTGIAARKSVEKSFKYGIHVAREEEHTDTNVLILVKGVHSKSK